MFPCYNYGLTKTYNLIKKEIMNNYTKQNICFHHLPRWSLNGLDELENPLEPKSLTAATRATYSTPDWIEIFIGWDDRGVLCAVCQGPDASLVSTMNVDPPGCTQSTCIVPRSRLFEIVTFVGISGSPMA